MKKRFLFVALGVLIAVGAMKFAAPIAVRHALVLGVSSACSTCKLSLNPLKLTFFPLALSGGGKFSGGTRQTTLVNVAVDELTVPFSLIHLLVGQVRVGEIEIEKPRVEIVEGDWAGGPSEGNSKSINFEIKGVTVNDGYFSYARAHRNRQGIIRIHQIQAEMGSVGNTARLVQARTDAWARARLENSGKFLLRVGAYLFQPGPKVDVGLHIKGQNLDDVNAFFKPNDGIQLSGRLVEGRSSVALREKRLGAKVFARFRGFEVKVLENQDRSALSAFFETLVADLKLGKQNIKGHYDRTGFVRLKQEPKQSLVSFILVGMKDAAMKVSEKAE